MEKLKLDSNRNTLLGLFLIWCCACSLALWKLGSVPLRDFDEGVVARVSFELSHKIGTSRLLPTIWGNEYLNKPPGLHWIIAIAININSKFSAISKDLPSEFVIRVLPAILSTLVVPLGGLIQWKLRPGDRISCLATSGILLTLLPIARHGRLAMLDGCSLTAMAGLWLLILSNDRSKMDRWRLFSIGLISSFMLLLKAPLLLPTTVAAIIPILWSQEIKSWWKWSLAGWLGVGLLPGVSWHLFHAVQRGAGALWLWGGDGAVRVLFDAGEGSDLGWKVPMLEILEGGWPWLILWPIGMAWAWQEKNSRWGKWALSTQIIWLVTIFLLKTQLPWYSHPLWLPISIICGVPLASLINQRYPKKNLIKKALRAVPFFWQILGLSVFFLGLLGALHLVKELQPFSSISICLGFGWLLGGLLLTSKSKKQRVKGSICMVTGSYLALQLLMGSSFWLWEINESWPVKPVANLASKAVKSEQVFIHNSIERPSLNWYANKQIKPIDNSINPKWILTRQTRKVIKEQSSQKCQVTHSEQKWRLILCE